MSVPTRIEIQAALTGDGFVFMPASAHIQTRRRKHVLIYTATPRWLGVTPDLLSSVELTGAPHDPPSITIVGAMGQSRPDVIQRNARLMIIALAALFPTWTQAESWLVKAIKRARMRPKTTTKHNYRTVSFAYAKTTGLATLVIA
jgi:hypothetical protein